MAAAIAVDVREGLVERGHGLHGQLVVHELRAEALLSGMLQQGILAVEDGISLFVGIDDDVLFSHRFNKFVQYV